MPGAAQAKSKPKTDRELMHERLTLERDNAKLFTKIDAVNAELIVRAGTAVGGSLKETFLNEGKVSVAQAKKGEYKGLVPEVVPEVFNALDKKRRKELEKAFPGLIIETPHTTRDFGGRVTVTTF